MLKLNLSNLVNSWVPQVTSKVPNTQVNIIVRKRKTWIKPYTNPPGLLKIVDDDVEEYSLLWSIMFKVMDGTYKWNSSILKDTNKKTVHPMESEHQRSWTSET